MVHASFPARFSVPRNNDRTFDKDVSKHPKTPKSNATKTRDRLRAEIMDSEFRNSEHLLKLHADLEFEKERVTKLVIKNVDGNGK